MGKTTNLKEPTELPAGEPESIALPDPDVGAVRPDSLAAPNPDPEALARRVVPLKPAEPTEAQRMLERLLAVRNQLLEAAQSQEKTLASIRGRQDRGEVVPEAPARAQTGFFVAAVALLADLEATAKRITEQAQELREKF